ncbi:hypothetical protein JXM67_08710 [candidate division WOR-3 bacterium]|nr:hypothetical protein [candidate division WOR-3 bacterium]
MDDAAKHEERSRVTGGAIQKYIGEMIEVVTSDEEPVPLSFTWRGDMYGVKKIVRQWQDHGFSPASPKRRSWIMRRHRNCFIILTDTDEVFEIYLDRGRGRRVWTLYRKLKNAP